MSNYQYKTAQNFTTATHANTVLGQLNNRNTASALCRYIPFHKKENCHSFLKPTGSYGGNTVHPCVTIHRHTHTHTHTPLAYLYSPTHMLYTSTQRHTQTHARIHKHCTHTHVHTHGHAHTHTQKEERDEMNE